MHQNWVINYFFIIIIIITFFIKFIIKIITYFDYQVIIIN